MRELFLRLLALLLVILASLLGGCHTVSTSALSGGEKATAVVEADMRDWEKLTDDQKRHAHWAVGRALDDLVTSGGGEGRAIFATGPWDRSAGEAPRCPEDLDERIPEVLRGDRRRGDWMTMPRPGELEWHTAPGTRAQ